MRVKPYKPRLPHPNPKIGEYWIVEYHGKREVMKLAMRTNPQWYRCEHHDAVFDVKPVKRVNI
jgi:hypothetical protein